MKTRKISPEEAAWLPPDTELLLCVVGERYRPRTLEQWVQRANDRVIGDLEADDFDSCDYASCLNYIAQDMSFGRSAHWEVQDDKALTWLLDPETGSVEFHGFYARTDPKMLFIQEEEDLYPLWGPKKKRGVLLNWQALHSLATALNTLVHPTWD